MKIKHFSAAVFTAALLLSGCGKKDEAGAEAPAALPDRPKSGAKHAETIPGENEVRQALASKDYTGAVQKYAALKALVASPEQNQAYASLFGQLRSDLQDASQTDPKAAEALMTLRAMRNAR